MEKTIQLKYMELQRAYKKLESQYSALSLSRKKLQNDYDKLLEEMDKRIEDKVNSIINDVAKKIEISIEAKYKEKIEQLEKENARLRMLLGTNSNNSGMPTSTTSINKNKRIPNSRVKTGKSVGGQEGHKKNKLDKFKDEEIDETIEHQVEQCSCGSEDFEIIKSIEKDVLDYKIVVTRTRHKYNVSKCNKCGKIHEIKIPSNQKAECSYGENVKSLILLMLNDTNAPYNKIRKLITGISEDNINISEGYIAKLQTKTSSSLDNFILELKSEIIKQKILHWDDTVIMVDKKRACFRFYGNEKFAYYTAHEQKNFEGMEEDAIFKNLTKDTNLVHDHLVSNYNSDYLFNNCECNAHLIRDLTKVEEEHNHTWSSKLIELLCNANDNYEAVSNNFDEFDRKFDELIEEGLSYYSKYEFKKDNSEQVLLKRLVKYKENYTMFLKDLDIPFTNNLAERSLRMCKSKMKISGQFKNINYAKYYANIRSYIETCIRFKVNPYEALKRLQNDNPYTIDELKNM